ncbi:MAG: SCO family protein [Bacteroidia bacterium]|nr:SCO family protein [Bacteroidia bacterium]MCX7651281.1 SCO family protein [Bacteroidia bacterium]MDW8416229.1 SCO family protein [Bacteroidia bacterium]
MKRFFLLIGGMGVAGLVAGGWWWYDQVSVPPPRHSASIWPIVASYNLTDAEGNSVRSYHLQGKVVLLDFIYTRCASVCPRLQSRLRQTLQAIPSSDRLVAVSISLDPAHDTPAYLRVHAESYKVPGHRWVFWRPISQRVAIQLATSVFGLLAAPLEGEEILHSDAIILIDCEGRIRGVYSSQDERLLQHTQKLIRLCGANAS